MITSIEDENHEVFGTLGRGGGFRVVWGRGDCPGVGGGAVRSSGRGRGRGAEGRILVEDMAYGGYYYGDHPSNGYFLRIQFVATF